MQRANSFRKTQARIPKAIKGEKSAETESWQPGETGPGAGQESPQFSVLLSPPTHAAWLLSFPLLLHFPFDLVFLISPNLNSQRENPVGLLIIIPIGSASHGQT